MHQQEWQAQAKANLEKVATQARSMVQGVGKVTPGILYGVLSTATIYPLVEAARQAISGADFQLFSSILLLAGSIGGNLVAEQISHWYTSSEEDLAKELTQRAANDEAWRTTLDELLKKVDALRVVQTVASEADKADKDWLTATLREAFTAVGSGLTVGGDYIEGSVGDKNVGVAIGKQITQIINYYHRPDEELDKAALRRQIERYLAWVVESFGKIVFRGVEYRGLNVINLDLDQIYVPLQATTRQARQRQALSRRSPSGLMVPVVDRYDDQTFDIRLDQLLGLAPQLIVTGGPGCGKTTVLQHIAWTLAMALTQDPALATQKLGLAVAEGTTPLPLPLYLPLSRYVNYRRELRQRGRPDDPHKLTLLSFITHYMIERGMAPRLPSDFFIRLIEQEAAVILLLDGLDEVPNDEERRQVRAAIQDLIADKANLRVVVTCRIAAYKGETMLDEQFHPVHVQPLAEAQVVALVEHAFACIEPYDQVTRLQKIRELTTGIHDFEAERQARMGDRYQRLIDSPLMVRLLLLVFLTGRGFPQQRADLYERATQALIQPTHGLDAEVAQELGALVGGNPAQQRNLLEYLAFQMHQAGETQGREQSHDEIRRTLQQETTLAPLADAFLALTRVRGGLMEERLGAYRFFHLAFQEYLAACYLAKARLGEGGVGAVAAFFEAGPLLDSWWREPALLITGHFVSNNDLTNARRFVRRLAGLTQPLDQRQALSPDLQLAAAEIAQLSCLEWLGKDARLRDELTLWTAALLTNRKLVQKSKARWRSSTAVALGQLGDPRPGVGVKHGLPDFVWSKVIEPGPFVMGGIEQYDGKLQFTCDLITKPFQISCYPITVEQYTIFVEAGGYTQHVYWTKAGWQWRQKNQIEGPEENRAIFQTPNHPQTGVSWYEAVAFCNWLTYQLNYLVRLPTESEWERAARHTDGRNYPWGAKLDSERCNMIETGIGSTAAVGLFPGGDALCSAADMSGNVLEWCSTLWTDSYKNGEAALSENLEGDTGRVARGGSFDDGLIRMRCAYRSGYFPDARVDFIGFRVVLPGSETHGG